MDATYVKFNAFFTPGQVLEVPFFQRNYVWEEEQWERFLDDMENIHKSVHQGVYFMGSIILKEESSHIGGPSIKKVIDGQQRLTTFLLFLRALAEEKGLTKVFDEIAFTQTSTGKVLAFRHNHNDEGVFEKIICGKTKDIQQKEKESLVYQCYAYFKDDKTGQQELRLPGEDLNLTNKQRLGNLDWDKAVQGPSFLGVGVGIDEDEQQIFDTMNSIGIRLTTADLLKNKLFLKGEIEFFQNTWGKTFEKDNKEFWDNELTYGKERRFNIDLFLQAHLAIIGGDVKNISKMYYNYKKFLEKKGQLDKRKFIDDLIKSAKFYMENINPDVLTEHILNTPINRMNLIAFGMKNLTTIPYFLYLTMKTDSNERQNMLSLFENYLIRCAVCRDSTKHYNKLFQSFITRNAKTYEALKENLIKTRGFYAFPDDSRFREGFHKSRIKNDNAKVILYLIEKHIKGDMHASTLLPLKSYEIEHIMPVKWKSKWKPVNHPDKAKARDEALLTLGNLTLIRPTLNNSIKNASWDVKQRGMREYCTGLATFEKYLDYEEWNEDTIAKRADFLYDHAIKIWPAIK